MNEKKAKSRLGRRIKKLRMERGLTQGTASEKANTITEKRWSDIERGMYAVGLTTLTRIAKGLNVPVHELLIFEETESEKTNRDFLKKRILKLEKEANKMSQEMSVLKKNIANLKKSVE